MGVYLLWAYISYGHASHGYTALDVGLDAFILTLGRSGLVLGAPALPGPV
jgi:hypothetical protein